MGVSAHKGNIRHSVQNSSYSSHFHRPHSPFSMHLLPKKGFKNYNGFKYSISISLIMFLNNTYIFLYCLHFRNSLIEV